LVGWDQEDFGSRPAGANSSWDPYFQNNQSKMDWRYGSSSRVLSTEFKPSAIKRKKKKIPRASLMLSIPKPQDMKF
jgi:hypothetical protein